MIPKKTLVIIPARGGSKRIPRKNIKQICGQPMIFWPLMELAKIFKSNQILVSTDDQEILDLVATKGLSFDFLRPQHLADDFTGTIPVASNALEWFEQNYDIVDFVLIVYPTAVLLSSEDILDAFRLLINNVKANLVISATTFASPIQRALFINKNEYAEMYHPENYSLRSQDLTESFHDAGQFYLYRSKSLRLHETMATTNTILKILNRNYVIDIDTVEDLEIAESKMKSLGFKIKDTDWNFE